MTKHEIVERDAWLEARRELLAAEKRVTQAKDEMARARRRLPWVRVSKPYTFEGPRGRAALGDLFAGRSQLVMYHLMFAPDWDAACKSCSFWADHFDGVIPHLAARDITFVAVSHAARSKLAAYAERLGWRFDWYSSEGSDFNFDFGASYRAEQLGEPLHNFGTQKVQSGEMPGVSTFVRNGEGEIFHAYSTFGRGIESVNASYQLLDLAPFGRNEDDLAYPMEWVRRHDEYGT